jgi:hypothetical protein
MSRKFSFISFMATLGLFILVSVLGFSCQTGGMVLRLQDPSISRDGHNLPVGLQDPPPVPVKPWEVNAYLKNSSLSGYPVLRTADSYVIEPFGNQTYGSLFTRNRQYYLSQISFEGREYSDQQDFYLEIQLITLVNEQISSGKRFPLGFRKNLVSIDVHNTGLEEVFCLELLFRNRIGDDLVCLYSFNHQRYQILEVQSNARESYWKTDLDQDGIEDIITLQERVIAGAGKEAILSLYQLNEQGVQEVAALGVIGRLQSFLEDLSELTMDARLGKDLQYFKFSGPEPAEGEGFVMVVPDFLENPFRYSPDREIAANIRMRYYLNNGGSGVLTLPLAIKRFPFNGSAFMFMDNN